MDKMTVTILDRRFWGTGLPYPLQREVTISKICPCCGGERGKPKLIRQFDNVDYRYIHTWDNPCGHVDYYSDVLKEAESQQPKNR